MINSKNYLRQVGVSEVQFTLLLRRLEQEREKDLQNNKMKKEVCQVRLCQQRVNYTRHLSY